MRVRGWILLGVALTLIFSLVVWLSALWRAKIELKVARIEPNVVIDEAGGPLWLVTLKLENCGNGYLDLEPTRNHEDRLVEVKMGERWVEVKNFFVLGGARVPGGQDEISLIVPQGTEGCRLRLRYQSLRFKERVWLGLGPRGQQYVRKSPRLLQWFRSQQTPQLKIPIVAELIFPKNSVSVAQAEPTQ